MEASTKRARSYTFVKMGKTIKNYLTRNQKVAGPRGFEPLTSGSEGLRAAVARRPNPG